ncbi:MAG: hypothetical protein AB7U75_20700 [Hyphomicrobiaceae bacterium]
MTAITHHHSETHAPPSSADEAVSATVAGFAYSYALTAILSALLVLAKEESPTILNAMQSLTGHHWFTHGVFDVLVFLVLGRFLSRTALAQSATATALIWAIVGSTVLGGAIILSFYAY